MLNVCNSFYNFVTATTKMLDLTVGLLIRIELCECLFFCKIVGKAGGAGGGGPCLMLRTHCLCMSTQSTAAVELILSALSLYIEFAFLLLHGVTNEIKL